MLPSRIGLIIKLVSLMYLYIVVYLTCYLNIAKKITFDDLKRNVFVKLLCINNFIQVILLTSDIIYMIIIKVVIML